MSGTGIDFVPNVLTFMVPEVMLYQTYRCVWYRCCCNTEITDASGTAIDVATNLPSVRYRIRCRTELTEVSGTGFDVSPNLPKCPLPVLMSYQTHPKIVIRVIPAIYSSGVPRYVPYILITHPFCMLFKSYPLDCLTEKKSEK